MTRDDIIRMAEECGISEFENNESQADNIMRFAALVAAAERKRLEATAWGASKKWIVEAVAAEREECAKECDIQASWGNVDERFGARQCSHAIRSRGQKMT